MKKANPFYKSKKWLNKRERILRRDNYMCRESARFGKTLPANTVHHIYPLELYPELAFESWNLISMNTSIHNSFHDRNTDEVIGSGLYWQRKMKKEFEGFYASRK